MKSDHSFVFKKNNPHFGLVFRFIIIIKSFTWLIPGPKINEDNDSLAKFNFNSYRFPKNPTKRS